MALDDDVVGSFGSALVLILPVATAIRFAVTATVELVIHRLGRTEYLYLEIFRTMLKRCLQNDVMFMRMGGNQYLCDSCSFP